MPNWNDVLQEIIDVGSDTPIDKIRKKYLNKLHEYTGRNIITYYSGFMTLPERIDSSINDNDKNGFMATIHKLDRKKGLDLFLHTPGGGVTATESLVNYLYKMFDLDIRVIIPQMAMSAGTMIACSAKEIIMGKQSNLGPIDPQYGGIPAQGVLSEIKRAMKEVKEDPDKAFLWQTILSKYHPTFIGECEYAVDLSEQIVKSWLLNNMFKDDDDKDTLADTILKELGSHSDTKTHSRHIHIEDCEKMGLKVNAMEQDSELQDLILTIHHAYMHTFNHTSSIKIIENHNGVSIIETYNMDKS